MINICGKGRLTFLDERSENASRNYFKVGHNLSPACVDWLSNDLWMAKSNSVSLSGLFIVICEISVMKLLLIISIWSMKYGGFLRPKGLIKVNHWIVFCDPTMA